LNKTTLLHILISYEEDDTAPSASSEVNSFMKRFFSREFSGSYWSPSMKPVYCCHWLLQVFLP